MKIDNYQMSDRLTMPRRTLGKTGLAISPIGIGGWQLGGPITRAGRPAGLPNYNEPAYLRLLEKAVEAGVNFYETANHYGQSEKLIGKFLKMRPGTIIVSTKCGIRSDGTFDLSTGFIRHSINSSLKNLMTNHVDIFQVTAPNLNNCDIDSATETLLRLKEEGKLRYIGVSIRRIEDAKRLLKLACIDIIEVPYNLFIVHFNRYIIPKCLETGIGVIIKSPLNKGVLTGKFSSSTRFDNNDNRRLYLDESELNFRNNWINKFCEKFNTSSENLRDVALRFVLSNQAVSTAAVGMRSIAQLKQNIATANEPPMTAEEIKKIELFSFANREGFKWEL
jgi:aryl-alcohol dehydrogenase-like predicted oxidoreductase